jgi:hypothetical protein
LNNPLKIWLKSNEKYRGKTVEEIRANKCFSKLLTWVVKKNYQGACHDVSIVLHVLLNEVGVKNIICVGEVKISDSEYFDHSWIEADGCIYDVAVCAPNLYQYSHAPIFNGKSLSESGAIDFIYGASSPIGIDEVTNFVLNSNINQYLQPHPNGADFIWDLIKKIGKECNLKLNKSKLRKQYGETLRTHKQ